MVYVKQRASTLLIVAMLIFSTLVSFFAGFTVAMNDEHNLSGLIWLSDGSSPPSQTGFAIWVEYLPGSGAFTRYPTTGWYLTSDVVSGQLWYSMVLPDEDYNVKWGDTAIYSVEVDGTPWGQFSGNTTSNGTGSPGDPFPTPYDPTNDANKFNDINYVAGGGFMNEQQWDVRTLAPRDLIPTNVTVDGMIQDDYPQGIPVGGGTTVTIYFNVTSIGTLGTGVTFDAGAWNSSSNGDPDDIFSPISEFLNLGPLNEWGNTSGLGYDTGVLSLPWTAPTAPGDYWINITVDSGYDILEVNETNNTYILHFIVGPDLIPIDITVDGVGYPDWPQISPIILPAPDQWIHIEINMTNVGATSSGAIPFNVAFYNVSITDYTPIDPPFYDSGAVYSDLDVGVISFGGIGDWYAPAPGEFRINLTVDFGESVSELSEANNTYVLRILVGPDVIPDNVVASGQPLYSSPSQPVPAGLGQLVPITMNATNIGFSPTGTSIWVGFYNSSIDGGMLDQPFENRSVVELMGSTEPGNSIAVPTVWWLSPTTSGVYYVTLYVDIANQTFEFNETNNKFVICFLIGPDLTYTYVAVNGTLADLGDPSEIWYTGSGETIFIGVNATNVGASPTGSGFSISFTNCSVDGTPIDPPFDTFVWGNLINGDTTTAFITTWIVPDFVGDLYVNITIDYLDDVSESVETNNTYILHFGVGPDLIPTDVRVDGVPAILQSQNWYVGPGDIIVIGANATNVGISSTGVDFNITLHNTSIGGSLIVGDSNLFHILLSALGAGEDSGQNIWFWQAPLVAGDFYVNITVDYGNASVWEISEDNNIFTIHFVVAPDLIPTNIMVDGIPITSYPSEIVIVYPGQIIQIGANATNVGPSGTGTQQFTMTFWNSTISGLVFGLSFMDSGLLGPLDSGDFTSDFFEFWVAPNPDKPTDFYINITVDSTYNVPEWVETNNTYILHIRVDAPDLTPDKIEIEAAGGSVSITYDEPYLLPVSFVSEVLYIPLGSQMNITFWVGNIGGINQSIGTNVTAYNVSGIGGPPIDDPFYESGPSVVLLDSGESMFLLIIWPNPGIQGEYYFNVSIDYNGPIDIGGKVIELNETNNTFIFVINVTSIPITTLNAGTPTYQPGVYWYVNSTTELNFTVTGPNPPLYTEYRITDMTTGIIVQDWLNYTAMGTNFTMTWGEGTFLIEYNSTNAIGGTEPTRSKIIIVDDTTPTTNIIIGVPLFRISPLDILNVTSSTTIDLVAVDGPLGISVAGFDNASGINGVPDSGIYYRIQNLTTGLNVTGWREYFGFPFFLNDPAWGDGNYRIWFNSTDNLLQMELLNYIDLYLDNTGPITTISVGDPKHPHTVLNWYVKSTTPFTLSAFESVGSGANISTIEYRFIYVGGPSSGWILGTSFDISTSFMQGDGNYTIEFRARDNLGNLGPTGTMDIYVDDMPPQTVLNIATPRYRATALNMWNITSFTELNFTVDDGLGSGVNLTQFRIFNSTFDSGWITYIGNFTFDSVLPVVASDGVYTIEYNSIDYLGNGLTSSEDIYLDNTGPPTTIGTGNPKFPHPIHNWYVQSATSYTLSASESQGSGADSSTIEYYITYLDTGAPSGWIFGTSFNIVNAFMQDDGNYSIEFRARDNLGNLGPTGILYVEVDDTPPVTVLDIGDPKYPATISFPMNVTGSTPFNLTASDGAGSGVDAIYYRVNYENLLDWNLIPAVTYSGAFFQLTGLEGNYSIRYWAVDNVLNGEPFTEIQIIVDNSPPVSMISFLEPKYRANTTSDIINITNYTPINITSMDGGPAPVGVDYVEYMVDDDFDLSNGNETGWVAYTGLFELTAFSDGDYVIYYHAVDLLGNIEEIKNITIIVDSTAPVSEFRVVGINYTTSSSIANNTWWIRPDSILNLSSEDLGIMPVGNNYTIYWINGVVYGNFTHSITFDLSLYPNGTHVIEFRGIDFLTNIEPLKNATIIIDDAGPDMDLSSTKLPDPLPLIPTQQIDFTEQDLMNIDAIDMGVPPGDEPAGVWYIQHLVGDPNDPFANWRNITSGDYNVFDLIGDWYGNASRGYWHHNLSFRSYDNLGQEGPIVTLWVYIEGDTTPPRPPVLKAYVRGDVILLEWTPDTSFVSIDVHHYLIYRSTTKTGFDFDVVWVDTSVDDDHGPLPLRNTWNDTEALESDAPSQYYYIVRGVDGRGNIGYPSNIAGKVTLTFSKGYNTFSLPLAPFEDTKGSHMLGNEVFDHPADTVYRYNERTQKWMGRAMNMPGSMDDFTMEFGQSYMIYITENTVKYTFTGAPGTGIRFMDDVVGDNELFSEGLSITLEDGDVKLSWKTDANAIGYNIYRGTTRFGSGSLYDSELVQENEEPITGTMWNDSQASGNEYYYIVVPLDGSGNEGSSTYAIGINFYSLNKGYHTFSFMLDPGSATTFGSFAKESFTRDSDTIYYYHRESSDWQGHPKSLPENINTGNVVMGSGQFVYTHEETARFAIIGI
jgi:hypothetical protein